MAFRPAIFDCDILAFEIARLPKSMAKRRKIGGRFSRGPRAHEPDHWHSLLLRACSKRPRCGSATEKCHELAPPHSITSSARAIRFCGNVRPIAPAALRLTDRVNLSGACT